MPQPTSRARNSAKSWSASAGRAPRRSATRKIHAFFELHIEQGPILEDEGIDIGVVTHGQGLKWLQVTLTGKEAHTGSTPMPKRRNAGLGMARVIELVHEIAMDYQPDAVGAVGHMEVFPNSRNIIAGRTVFTIDIRSPEKEVLDAMDGRIREGIDTICEALDIQYKIEQVGHFDPVTFDAGCVKAIRDAAERLGYSHRNLVSGAGHDACWINRVAPTAMVMCPCVDGLSAQRGRGNHQGMGGGRRRRAVPRGGGDGGDRGVNPWRVREDDRQRKAYAKAWEAELRLGDKGKGWRKSGVRFEARCAMVRLRGCVLLWPTLRLQFSAGQADDSGSLLWKIMVQGDEAKPLSLEWLRFPLRRAEQSDAASEV